MKFKEKIDCLRFAFRMSLDFDKTILPIFILRCLILSIEPLIPTVFSAQIVDSLGSGESAEKIILYGAVMALLITVFTFGLRITSRVSNEKAERLHIFESKVFEENIITKDFELLEDADFQKNVKAYKVVYQNNYGIFWNMWESMSEFITGMLACIFSVTVAGPVIIKCFSIDNSSFITSYKPLLILGAVVAVCISIMLPLGNANARKINAINQRYNDTFGVFEYWFSFAEKYRQGKEIRIYDAKDFVIKKNKSSLQVLLDIGKDEIPLNLQNYTVMNVFQMVLMGSFYLFVALKAYAGVFSIGSFVLFLGASLQIANGVGMLGTITFLFDVCSERIAYLKRIIDAPPRKYVGTLPVEKRNDNKYDIEFHNVSFKYPNTDEYVLKSFNAKLKIGNHMAVVGKNGSGKTTFIKLLCRLYDVTDGEITLNGVNIKKYNLQEYMSLFSVVFQDFQLFSVPLSQNVTTSLEYDKEKLFDCLDKAGIKERVEEMPEKENTVLYKDFDENGVEISGGEAQKIALARALYKDAPFVILDEPTSALDPVSEFEIYQRFNSFVGDKTAIYISHRLSSCRFCNNIFVFDNGQIVQQGSHDDLVKNTDGQYYKLWSSQSQYYVG